MVVWCRLCLAWVQQRQLTVTSGEPGDFINATAVFAGTSGNKWAFTSDLDTGNMLSRNPADFLGDADSIHSIARVQFCDDRGQIIAHSPD